MTKRSKEAIAQRRQALLSAAQTPRFPSAFISYCRKDKAIAKALADDPAKQAAVLDFAITLHVPGFDPADIPLGFGDHHCESIEDRERLIATLIARHATAA